jgi:hypothetical protein
MRVLQYTVTEIRPCSFKRKTSPAATDSSITFLTGFLKVLFKNVGPVQSKKINNTCVLYCICLHTEVRIILLVPFEMGSV